MLKDGTLLQLIRELIEGGFIGQAVIATVVTVGIMVMVYQGRPIPEFLTAAWGLIVGWFFRSQAQVISNHQQVRKYGNWRQFDQ